ncbi:MAG: MltA domain-containing protein [Planctomycetota bacterium]
MLISTHRSPLAVVSLPLAGLGLLLSLTGCQPAEPVEPDYASSLPEGAFGLRQITDPAERPSLRTAARQMNEPGFREALDRSLVWFDAPSSRRFYPSGPISHGHAQVSLYAMREIAVEPAAAVREQRLEQDFDVWQTVGWDGSGDVLFTAYHSPIFDASLTPTPRFRYPIYTRPADLVTDPNTGVVYGRATPAGSVEPFQQYPTRADLAASGELNGLELAYLSSALDAYLIQLNGSAKLTLTDGSTMHVGYAGTNGRPYTSVAQALIADGHLAEGEANLPNLRRLDDGLLAEYINRNERFVFLQPYQGDNWPAGSMGFRVTPMRSLATDKAIFPRGSAVLVDTSFPTPGGGTRPFGQLMLDQDTGGAIRAAGRADIYTGIGDDAEDLAGRQKTDGTFYYLLLTPDAARRWHRQMTAQPQASAR